MIVAGQVRAGPCIFLVHPDQSGQVPANLWLFELVLLSNIGEYDIVLNLRINVVNDDRSRYDGRPKAPVRSPSRKPRYQCIRSGELRQKVCHLSTVCSVANPQTACVTWCCSTLLHN